jgi:hypothetical protein
MSNHNSIEFQKLRAALEQARHELVTIQGATATDRPDLFNFDVLPNAHWVIDNRQVLAAIDQALGIPSP